MPSPCFLCVLRVACCVLCGVCWPLRGTAGTCKSFDVALYAGVESRHRSLSDTPAARKWMRFCLLSGTPYMPSSSRLQKTTTTRESIRFTLSPRSSRSGYGLSSRGTSILGTGLYRSAFLSQRCVPVLNLSGQLHPNAVPQAASPHWTSVTLQNPTLEAHLADPGLLPGSIGSPSSHASQHTPLPGIQHQYSASQKFVTCYDPSTGYHLGTLPADSEFDISEKINRARRAWSDSLWAQSSFGDRKRVIRSLKKWLVENREACARVACRDTGKTSKAASRTVRDGY